MADQSAIEARMSTLERDVNQLWKRYHELSTLHSNTREELAKVKAQLSMWAAIGGTFGGAMAVAIAKVVL